MGKARDKAKGRDDNNESLVLALESIKSLLASGGKKRAAVKEDTELVTPAESQAGLEPEAEPQGEPEVPVLENIIIPGRPVAEPARSDEATATPPAEAAETTQADALAAFQAELEHEMRNKLADYVSELEQELKHRIAAFIQAQQEK